MQSGPNIVLAGCYGGHMWTLAVRSKMEELCVKMSMSAPFVSFERTWRILFLLVVLRCGFSASDPSWRFFLVCHWANKIPLLWAIRVAVHIKYGTNQRRFMAQRQCYAEFSCCVQLWQFTKIRTITTWLSIGESTYSLVHLHLQYCGVLRPAT